MKQATEEPKLEVIDKTSTTQKVFRGIVFLAHAVTSIVLLVLLYTTQKDRCNRNLHWYTSNLDIMHYAASNSSGLRVEPITTGNGLLDITCGVEGYNGKCQYTTPNVMAIEFDSSSWHLGGSVNVIALMCIFEYLTASFALVYFAKSFRMEKFVFMKIQGERLLNVALMVAGFWNFAFTVLMFTKSPTLPASHTFLFAALGSIVASFVQYRFSRKIGFGDLPGLQPLLSDDPEYKYKNAKVDRYGRKDNKSTYDKNEFRIRYAEYAITAPLVFIASLVILSLSGVTATSLQLSFVSMSVCNLLGIVIHELYVADSGTIRYDKEILFALGASWYAWVCAWLPYLFKMAKLFNAIDGIPDTSAKDAVRAVIALMIIFYALFGILPTAFVYLPPVFRKGEKFVTGETWMRVWAFDTLSLCIKLIIVGIVASSDIFQPRAGC